MLNLNKWKGNLRTRLGQLNQYVSTNKERIVRNLRTANELADLCVDDVMMWKVVNTLVYNQCDGMVMPMAGLLVGKGLYIFFVKVLPAVKM